MTDELREKEFGYCRHCKKKVMVLEPSLLPISGRKGTHMFIQGKCELCQLPIKSIRGKPQ